MRRILRTRPVSYPYRGKAHQIGFIVGTGRCGTTILAQVLNAHSQICVPPELQFIFTNGAGSRLYDADETGRLSKWKARDFIKLVSDYCPYNLENFFDYQGHFKELIYPQNDAGTIVREFFDHICHQHDKRVLLEQTPWHGQFLEELHQLFPAMKIIHMIRDGHDVAISFSKTPWWSKDIYENMRQWEREILNIHEFGLRHPDHYLALKYEDLVMNPIENIVGILNRFNLQIEDGMLNPAGLFDYLSIFKGNAYEYQSQKFTSWNNKRDDIFF